MTKEEARREARARLRAITPESRAAAGARIAERVWTLPRVAAARTILLYASLPDEVDTAPIAHEARRRGVTVLLPRCIVATREMRLHLVDDDAFPATLRTGAYGLREPDPALCAEIDPADVDVALVPGLAWDRAGTRLGRGAGYYDRLFARADWRAYRCALQFAVQELQELPADPWDAVMDAVVTEREGWMSDAGRNYGGSLAPLA